MHIHCMSFLRKSKKVEFCTSFFAFTSRSYLYLMNMKISLVNILYPLMVAHHQTLDYSIIMKPFFQNWNILIVEFIEVIHGNDYLTFYNIIEGKENLGDLERSLQLREEEFFFTDFKIYYLLKKQKILRLFASCLCS